MGLVATAGSWFSNSSQFWEDWPAQAPTRAMAAFYAAEMGFYAYGLADLLLSREGSRADGRRALLVHHASSLGLLTASFHYNFLRVGAVICVINDACDIWLEAAKLASYARAETLSAAFYCAFAATWAVLRMAYSPLVVFASVYSEAWTLVERFGASDFHVGLWATFNVLLLVLQVQHAFWWYLIIKKIRFSASIKIVNNPKKGGHARTASTDSATGDSSE